MGIRWHHAWNLNEKSCSNREAIHALKIIGPNWFHMNLWSQKAPLSFPWHTHILLPKILNISAYFSLVLSSAHRFQNLCQATSRQWGSCWRRWLMRTRDMGVLAWGFGCDQGCASCVAASKLFRNGKTPLMSAAAQACLGPNSESVIWLSWVPRSFQFENTTAWRHFTVLSCF